MGQKNKYTLGALVILTLGGYGFHKVVSLTAEPGEDKSCDPLFPDALANDRNTEWVNETPITWIQKQGTINDASCVDETSIYGIAKINTEEDIKNALAFARARSLHVTMAGVRHSMGGQAFAKGNLILDMTGYNTIALNEASSTVTVASGATWHDIQNTIHPKFAIKAMQSTDIFTVGGSISVNAHGMDHQAGAVENSIVHMRIMLADGSIKNVSRTENTDLYEHIVGGYGLYGVILDVTLQVVPNDVYESKRTIIDYKDMPTFFTEEIFPNQNVGLMYTHLSTAPGQSFLREGIVYTYTKNIDTVEMQTVPSLGEISSVKLRRLVMNMSKWGPFWQQLRWWSEKYLEPKMESCSVSRNSAQASGEACLVARNEPMHDSVPYLRNSLKGETDILHEYFIPRTELVSFIDGVRAIMEANHVNLLNASIRVVNAERGALTYAPAPAYSIVLYINQKTDTASHDAMAKTTRELIDLTIAHNGRFFLPYQLHYTGEQLRASYPGIDAFFTHKKTYDPIGLFTNTWFERYKTI